MVRYHNSGTQKFDDTEHESLDVEVSNSVRHISDTESISDIITSGQGNTTYVIDPGSHAEESVAELSSGDTLIIRGDITYSRESEFDAPIFKAVGTDADKLENVWLINDGGTLTVDPNSTYGGYTILFEHVHTGGVVNLTVDNSDRGLVMIGQEDASRPNKDLWIRGGTYLNGYSANPPVELAGTDGGGVIGITSDNGAKTKDSTQNLNVSNCSGVAIANNSLETTPEDNLTILNILDSVITSNTLRNAGQDGIVVGGDAGDRDNNVISNNSIVSPDRNGIRAISSNSAFSQNLINGAGGDGIDIGSRSRRSNVISENYIHDCDGAGITGSALEMRIKGNVIDEVNGHGIEVIDPFDSSISHNHIEGPNADAGNSHAIKATDGADSMGGEVPIVGNVVTTRAGTPENGINLDGSLGKSEAITIAYNNIEASSSEEYALNGRAGRIMSNTPMVPLDLTNNPVQADTISLHDGTDGNNTNSRGPAYGNGTDWVSLIDGSVID